MEGGGGALVLFLPPALIYSLRKACGDISFRTLHISAFSSAGIVVLGALGTGAAFHRATLFIPSASPPPRPAHPVDWCPLLVFLEEERPAQNSSLEDLGSAGHALSTLDYGRDTAACFAAEIAVHAWKRAIWSSQGGLLLALMATPASGRSAVVLHGGQRAASCKNSEQQNNAI